jgi:hypothetical protein
MAMQETADAAGANMVQLRIVRGARAQGSDGRIGTVQQIVVDPQTGELRAVVVQHESDSAEFELPVDLIQSTTGDEVRFTLARADLETRPELARPYDPDQFTPLDQRSTAPRTTATRTAWDTEHLVVTSIEEDAAELVAPARVAGVADTAEERAEARTTTSEMGAATTPTNSTIPPQDTTGTEQGAGAFGAPAQREPDVASTDIAGGHADLTDLTDDELSNPDSALANPQSETAERVTRPFNMPPAAEETTPPVGSTARSPEEQAGMAKVFRIATNIAADDTYVVRERDEPPPPHVSTQEPARSTPRTGDMVRERQPQSAPWWSTPLARALAIGAVIGMIALVRGRRRKTA